MAALWLAKQCGLRATALNLFSPTAFLFFFLSYLCSSPFLLSTSFLLHLPSVSHPYSIYIYFPMSHTHIIYHFPSNNPFIYCLLPSFFVLFFLYFISFFSFVFSLLSSYLRYNSSSFLSLISFPLLPSFLPFFFSLSPASWSPSPLLSSSSLPCS